MKPLQHSFEKITLKTHPDAALKIARVYSSAHALPRTAEARKLFAEGLMRARHWLSTPGHEIIGFFAGRRLIGFGVIANWMKSDYQLHELKLEKVRRALERVSKTENALVLEGLSRHAQYRGKKYGRKILAEMLARVERKTAGKNTPVMISVTPDSKSITLDFGKRTPAHLTDGLLSNGEKHAYYLLEKT